MKLHQFVTGLFCILLTAGCRRATMATISARSGDSPLVFHCSSDWETLLGRYRISLVPGGDFYRERHESREFEGSGKLLLTWNRDKELTFFLHAHPRYYPITVDVSWEWKGNRYHKSVVLYEEDMTAQWPLNDEIYDYDRENPTYSYYFILHSNGQFNVRKNVNFESLEIGMSKAMRIMEKAKN